MNMSYSWLNNIQSLLYPPTCRLCKAPGVGELDLCTDCLEDLPHLLHACRCCALPIDSDLVELCGTCQRTPPPYDNTYAAFLYDFPITKLVSQLKFQGKLAHAHLLGRLMTESLASSVSGLPECIIPVPLHSRRICERGYNQSLELARYLSRSLHIALDVESVIRVRHTPPQTGLSESDRRKNVRGTFRVNADLRCAHVAIVDDVVTTGSTVGELARTLKCSGVERVDVWALARTP